MFIGKIIIPFRKRNLSMRNLYGNPIFPLEDELPDRRKPKPYDYHTDNPFLRKIIDINRFGDLEGNVPKDLIYRSIYCSGTRLTKTIEEHADFLRETHGIVID